MRILFINDYMKFGGAEYVLQRLVSLLGKKYEVGVLTRYNSKPLTQLEDLFLTGKQILTDMMGHDPLIDSSIESSIRSFDPDIVHFHNISHFGYKLLYKVKKLGIPSIITVHDYWAISVDKNQPFARTTRIIPRSSLLNNLYSPIARSQVVARLNAFFSFPTKIVAVSQFVARCLVKFCPQSKVAVIHNGVDFEELENSKKILDDSDFPLVKGNRFILFTGGFSKLKGFQEILKLAPLIRRKAPECTIAITGINFMGKIKQNKLYENIVILGELRRDIFLNYLRNSVCVLFPSIWPEPCPISVLEAMALGKPVVAYAVGGIPELIKNAETGFLIRESDYISMAERVEYLLENPAEITAIGMKAKKDVARNFSANKMCLAYDELYNTLSKS
jgi:glycosyltransferase involved in cell wall biosynthesis